MTSTEKIDASAATQAATGITHYVFDADSGWQAFGKEGAEIAVHIVSKVAQGRGVVRINLHDRRVEISYLIDHDDNGITIHAVVNGVSSKAVFAKDGVLIEGGLKTDPDPALHEVFRSIGRDLISLREQRGRSAPIARPMGEPIGLGSYCGGLFDAIEGADGAHEDLARFLLEVEFDWNC